MIDKNLLDDALNFVAYIDRLKSVIRKNGLHDNSRAENTAEHSWHAALSALILAPYANFPVEIDKVVRMLLVHDLIEIEAGDTFVYDAEKVTLQDEAELRAADLVFSHLPADQAQPLRALWDEFEARQTPEAKFAKAIDRFLPLYSNTRNNGFSWAPYDVSAKQVRHIAHIIQDGSSALWEKAEKMIDDAVEQGHLRP